MILSPGSPDKTINQYIVHHFKHKFHNVISACYLLLYSIRHNYGGFFLSKWKKNHGIND